MMASAGASAISFWLTNEPVRSAVALEDCTSPVTPSPARKAVNGLDTLLASTRRRLPPSTRSTPERTMCVPQTSSAIPERTVTRVCTSKETSPRDGIRLHIREAFHRLYYALFDSETRILDAAERRALQAVARDFPDVDRTDIQF